MEKVSKKKERKGIRKGWLLALAFLLCALAAGGIYLLTRPVLPEPTLLPDIILLEKSGDEISALGISSSSGASYPLVLQESGEFFLMGQEDVALREHVVQDMCTALSGLEAEDALWNTQEHIVDLSHFGLSPAQAQVTITYLDGEKKALYIGHAASTEEPQYYCMVSDDPTIYTVLATFCDPFFRDADYLRAFDQPDLDASLLDRIDISGSLNLSLSYDPSGWVMEIPFSYPLSTPKTDTLLKQIESMAFEACLGTADALDLSRFGLDHPVLTVTLTQAPTVITGETETGEQMTVDVPMTQYVLHLGNETGQSGVYLLWDGKVFRASNFLLGFWKELSVDPLLLRNPVNLLTNDLVQVFFTRRSQSKGYEVELIESITPNNQIATDEYGQILYDVAVHRAAEQILLDPQVFLAWYTQLSSLAPAGKLPAGYVPQGEETARITLQSLSISREISFYSYDPLHDAMAVDGVCIYFVEKAALDALWASAP